MNLEVIMLSEKANHRKKILNDLQENSKIVKFIEVESRIVAARHGGTKFQL